jgi:hypothetical protein
VDGDALSEYGNHMFGRRIRLRVLLWAEAQHEAFNQSETAAGVSYSSSGEVAKELERLVRLGMLRKFGRPSRVGPQNYLRVEHPGWAIAVAARGAVEKGLPEHKESESTSAPVGGGGTTHARVRRVRGNRTI